MRSFLQFIFNDIAFPTWLTLSYVSCQMFCKLSQLYNIFLIYFLLFYFLSCYQINQGLSQLSKFLLLF
jgi:hypothetical protein